MKLNNIRYETEKTEQENREKNKQNKTKSKIKNLDPNRTRKQEGIRRDEDATPQM